MAATARQLLSLHPLLGHESVREALASAHARQALPAALLMHGARGAGKQRLALWLARLLVCQNPSSGPCDRCGPCRMASSLKHPDIHWYFPLARPKKVSGDRLVDALEDARLEAIADIRVDSLRPSHSDEVRGLYLGTVRNIRARAYKRPTMAPGPVFIVGDAEFLVPQEASPEAANALLKILEEPPGSAHFILTSSEPGLLLPTIRSRTVHVHVGALPDEDVAGFLKEHAGVDATVASWAATLAHGSVGRALGFLPEDGEPGPLESLRWQAFDLVMAATTKQVASGYGIALGFPPAGARKLMQLFAFVDEWLRDLGAAAAGADDLIFNRDALGRLKKHVAEAEIDAVDVPMAFSKVEVARELARGNVNPQLVVSGLILEIRTALAAGTPLAGASR